MSNRRCSPKEKMKNAEDMKKDLIEAALGWFSKIDKFCQVLNFCPGLLTDLKHSIWKTVLAFVQNIHLFKAENQTESYVIRFFMTSVEL